MSQLQVTIRTKQAIRQWADLQPSEPIFLDHQLSRFRANGLDELLVTLNREFENDPQFPRFPVTAGQWQALDPETVRDVRDEVRRREA